MKYRLHIFFAIFSILFVSISAIPTQGANYNPSSVLSSGRWVKIRIDSTAVYRIDYATLRAHGFQNPENVTIHGYGSVEQAHAINTAPDDLPQIAITHIGDAIYFFGEGDRRISIESDGSYLYEDNFYSKGSHYFLTENTPEKVEIDETPFTESEKYEDSHIHVDLRTPHEYNIHDASVFFFSRNFASHKEGYSVNFDVTDYAGGGEVSYRYVFQHNQPSAQYLSMTFLGDVKSGAYSLGGVNKNTEDNLLYSRSVLKKISVTPTSDKGFSMNFSYRDGCVFKILAMYEVCFKYSRYNHLGGSMRLLRYAPSASARAVRILDNNPNLRVWDVSTPRHPHSAEIGRDDNDYALVNIAPAASGRSLTLCAFIPGKEIPEPTFIGDVNCRNLHASEGFDYLIVTTQSFIREARRLADAHSQYQGLKVGVVTQDEVFNEFSSGSSHPNGLRKYINMLSQHPSRPLRYLLMFGGGTYDPKGYTIKDDTDYLVGYETERVEFSRYNSYDFNTDLYFAVPTDEMSDNPAEYSGDYSISVGRAPVLSNKEAKIFVDKCIEYLTNPSSAGRFDRAMLSCRSGDDDTHILSSEIIYSDIKNTAPSTVVNRVYGSLYDNNTFSKLYELAFAESPMFVNFTGHCNTSIIGDYINVGRIKNFRYGSHPIFYLAGCLTVPIKSPIRGIGTQMFLDPDGPIAVIGSGHDVYITNNHVLNEAFARHLYSTDSGCKSLGDIWRDALNEASSTLTQRINNFGYSLLGDPALPLYRPESTVKIDFIGDSTPGDNPVIKSLSPVILSGSIIDSDGNIDTNFNGTLTLSLLDTPIEKTRNDKPSANGPKSFTLEETELHKIGVNVEAGKWSATFTAPAVSSNGLHSVTMLAYSENGSTASGLLSGISLNAPDDSSLADITAPDIEMSIETELSASELNGFSPYLFVTLSDYESGLSTNTSAPGGALKVLIDDMTNLSAEASRMLQFDGNGRANIRLRLPDLTNGRHCVSVTAKDMAGNVATRSLSFEVSNAFDAELLADSGIVRESVTFELGHSLNEQPAGRLIVRDRLGNTVFSADAVSFPYDYDLRDNSGKHLPDGRYRATAILTSGYRYGASSEVSFTVAKPLSAK